MNKPRDTVPSGQIEQCATADRLQRGRGIFGFNISGDKYHGADKVAKSYKILEQTQQHADLFSLFRPWVKRSHMV